MAAAGALRVRDVIALQAVPWTGRKIPTAGPGPLSIGFIAGHIRLWRRPRPRSPRSAVDRGSQSLRLRSQREPGVFLFCGPGSRWRWAPARTPRIAPRASTTHTRSSSEPQSMPAQHGMEMTFVPDRPRRREAKMRVHRFVSNGPQAARMERMAGQPALEPRSQIIPEWPSASPGL